MVSPLWVYDPNRNFPMMEYDDADDPNSISIHLYARETGRSDSASNKSEAYATIYNKTSMPPGGACHRAKVTNAGRPQMYWKSQLPSSTAWYESWRQREIRKGRITEGEWPLKQFNRARFFHRYGWDQVEDIGDYPPGFTGIDTKQDVQIGGYIAHPTTVSGTGGQEDATEYWDDYRQSFLAGHTYHNSVTGGEAVWHQAIIDPKPVHNRNASMESPYHETPYPSTYPEYGYFDLFRDMYVHRNGDFRYLEGHVYYDMMLSGVQVFRDDNNGTGAIVDEQNLVDHISSLSAAYQPQADVIHWGLCCRRRQYTVQCRYSFSTTYGQSFDSLTPLPNNPEFTTNGDSYEQCIFRDTIPWAGNPVVYMAFRVKDNPEWGHREIAVCFDPTQLPPLPGETLD